MKTISYIIIFIFTIQLGFSQKYWEQSNLSGSFDKSKNYKVAILPVTSGNPDLLKLESIAYNTIITELMACSNLQVINRSQVEQGINKFSYGVSGLDAGSYPELAKNLGVDILVLCDLSSDKQTIKKKEIGTVLAFIQLLDMKNSGSVLYAGKGRSLNPISLQAETEYAINIALKKLTNSKKNK